MDRGRRSSGTRRGGMGGRDQGYRKMEPPTKFGGTMVAPDLPKPDENSLVIDPNLLVGPLYVPQTSKADRIKEQLGDITQKLHSTLYAFDEYAEYEEEEDPLLRIMRDQIGGLSDKDMQDKLNQFMDQYEDMHCQVSEANKDRDEMLLQLADWFTTDHVDLDDIKSSMDDTEEEGMKQSYFDTITNFEKIKRLQTQIVTASKNGKPTKQLQKVKLELEKDVVDKFKVMKDMSMQTMKLKVSDDAPWKYAANEIVSMLKNVRTENAEELSMITKKMQEMVDQLEKQALTIKSLTAELREKKEVVSKLTDENGDLSQDVAMFRARYARYEKDLESAKQMIRSLHQEKLLEMEGREVEVLHGAQGKSLSESISKVLAQFEEPVINDVKQMSSDPALLRTQLRDYQEALDSIRSEFSRVAEEADELKSILDDKKEYINNMEAENEKLVKDIRKMRQERRQSIAAGQLMPAAGDAHQCEHCKCHIPEKEIDEEVEDLKKEVKQWQDKCNYFKKILADTEMKLSDAYKEISDLRMDRDVPMPPPPAPEPTPVQTPKPAPAPSEVVSEKKERTEKEAPKPKPAKPKIRSRYMEPSQPQRQAAGNKLPPIDRTPIEQKIEEQLPTGLTAKQSRELKLYKAGDIQGKMNMIVTEIMEFVTEIGRMLYTEKDDDGAKIQQMKAFTFENSMNGQNKQQKPLLDPKEEEARQRKSQVMFIGQHACAKLREAYDLLSHNLGLRHDEFEAIYRAYKISQQRNNLRHEVMMGRMPMSTLRDFDRQQQKASQGQDNLLAIYFNISYGGGPSSLLARGGEARQGSGAHHRLSRMSSGSEFDEESEAKLKNTMNVLSMQRSKSDLDHREGSRMGDFSLFGDGLNRERSQIYMTNTTDQARRDSMQQANKQEMRMGMAVVPRKGLIHLSTNDEDTRLPVDDFLLHGEKRRPSANQDHPIPNKTKGLIKRKDIMEHFRVGTKLLEDAEAQKQEEEEMSKSLGNYTIMDLQSKILEMTDAKSLKRGPSLTEHEMVPSTPGRRKEAPPKEKPITLPAIKNINPFTMK